MDPTDSARMIQTKVQKASPESKTSDILRIHHFLTSPDLEIHRKAVNLDEVEFNLDDLERQHTDEFIKYWDERGVEIVSTSTICQRINKSLLSEKRNTIGSEFSPIYYKVKNMYIILYRKKSGHIEKGINPVQILDEDFRILSKYKI